MPNALSDEQLVAALLGKPCAEQRRALAKAITLLESTRLDHRARADQLLNTILPHTGKSFRLGISGVPGVGKSTLIENLGLYLISKGHRVAVLAIDPSSSLSGGSILGDKTRMELLSVNENAFIRPSPSSGTLGGVAERTREVMLLAEAAGHDVVIVETVGVGQSEIAVAGMTDLFMLLQLPNAGDDLQAIKKGIMELADLVLINKADLDANAATRAQAHISSALRLFAPHPHTDIKHAPWQPPVMLLSALKGAGLEDFWGLVQQHQKVQKAQGLFIQRRQNQSLTWMNERIQAGLQSAFKENPAVKNLWPELTALVLSGQLAPSTASRRLLQANQNHPHSSGDIHA